MSNLIAARAQMAFSLGWHMIFAAIGVGMPLLMLIAEGLYLRTGKDLYLNIAKTWAKVTGILFAIGAVSGTALSFEMGLLWPRFMGFAGGAVGPAFALEGFAFFIEAIFIGLYLYGWERLSAKAHWWTGVPIALSGMTSSVLVVAADAWMQNPLGAALLAQDPAKYNPMTIFHNPAWVVMSIHSTMAAYAATAFAVSGVYAWGYLKGRRDAVRMEALKIALIVCTITALIMPISGDSSAKFAARNQPTKLAAMEALFHTEKGAPLLIGGWPNPATQKVQYAIALPGGLSFLAFGDFHAEVKGLDVVPHDLWPNVQILHVSFQIMVAAGGAMVAVVLWFWLVWRKRRGNLPQLLAWALLVASPLGFVALETGWMVTEIGRQPWILYGVMRTAEAVTTAPDVASTFWGFVLLYLLLTFTLLYLLLRLKHKEVGLEHA